MYQNGGLQVIGDGAGATAHGTLDQFGRFTNITLDSPGEFYTFATIVPTASQNSIAPWNDRTIYQATNLVTYGSLIYECLINNTSGSFESPGNNPLHWGNQSIGVNQPASFTQSISAISGGITLRESSSYGPSALGDQTALYQINTGVGILLDNLWGTPLSSGFIILTHVNIVQLSNGSSNAWQIENANGGVLWGFEASVTPVTLLALHGCNIKLPATLDWRIRGTSSASALGISNGFAWTFSPN